MFHLLLVEDDDSIAVLLSYTLQNEGFSVVRTETLEEARQAIQEREFQIVVLDVKLPDGSGFDLCLEFRKAGLRVPIMMLTAQNQTVDKVYGLEIGADDYVSKPFDQSELIARLHALVRRSYGNLSDAPSTRMYISDLVIDFKGQRVEKQGVDLELTQIQFKLLALFVQNPEKIFSREDILEYIWGYERFAGGIRIIDVHIRHLRQKIEDDPNNPQLIVTIWRKGYKLRIPSI